MIARYSRKDMAALWEPQRRFDFMLQVEKMVAEVQAEAGIIPKEAHLAIQQRGQFTLERILEIETTTRHDVIAFVSAVAETVGEEGKYLHFGLTSSDVLDTALSLQIQEGGKLLLNDLNLLLKTLESLATQHHATLCLGRTHGIVAEPTTFGYKLLGHHQEFLRHLARFEKALEQLKIGKLSGAVGTYSSQSPDIEKAVCERLGLKPEAVATQVIPRDRHAELFLAMAQLAGGIERLAVELRHLQRSEVNEIQEGFAKKQKGSSAMPHKRNPISAENLTGCARLIRSYVLPALENTALWHERDISHSSVERVILPDAFILLDYSLSRLTDLLQNLEVHPERMKENLEKMGTQIFSSQLLLALVEKGMSREKAYELVQGLFLENAEKGLGLMEILHHSELKKWLSEKELRELLGSHKHLQTIRKQFENLGYSL